MTLWTAIVIIGLNQVTAATPKHPIAHHLAAMDAEPGGGAPLPRTTLDVVLINDRDFRSLTLEEAHGLLTVARKTLKTRFGYDGVEFRLRDGGDVEAFLSRHVSNAPLCMRTLPYRKLTRERPKATETMRQQAAQFLTRWRLEELAPWFAGHPPSYKDLANRLVDTMETQIHLLANTHSARGTPLLSWYHSNAVWACALEAQNEADVILTNSLLIYDVATQPFPHGTARGGRIGGGSYSSWYRHGLDGKAIIASIFGARSPWDWLAEPGLADLDAADQINVVGTILLAHELGHALFNIPDVYDHGPECLMDTAHDGDYLTALRTLSASVGICPRCAPYLAAHRLLGQARAAERAGHWREALGLFQRVLDLTPPNVDGDYRAYASSLHARRGFIYYALGEHRDAVTETLAAWRLHQGMPAWYMLTHLQRELQASRLHVKS